MIRVLNVISDTNIGGAGRVLLNYLRYTDRESFRTCVALPRGSLLRAPLEESGARVLEVEGMADRSYHREDVKNLRKLMGELKPDVVHTHGCLSGRIAAKRCHIPVVYSRHSAFPVPARLKYPPGRWVNKLVNEHYADHIIAVSPAARDNLTEGGISPGKITVVMNGVSPVPRTSSGERAALKAELDIPEQDTVFGILARLEDYKGHLDLAEAVRLLRERGREDFTVLAAGTGPFARTLAKAVRESGVEDKLKLLGFRSDVAAVLNILDVQLNCSYGTEATSMALLEGMSLGLPTIASDYGGNPYVIAHGLSGLLYPSRDVRALADAMERLMDRPRERDTLGWQARQAYEARFTGEIFAKNIEKVYRNVLKGEK